MVSQWCERAQLTEFVLLHPNHCCYSGFKGEMVNDSSIIEQYDVLKYYAHELFILTGGALCLDLRTGRSIWRL